MEILEKKLEILKHQFPFKEQDDGSIVFLRKENLVDDTDYVKVTFEDYMVHPFKGFDFNDRFNFGIPPFERVMYGKIVEQTEKMYKFELHTEQSLEKWVGWCPKKSCKVGEIF